jgi:hypothetical protein
MVALSMSPFSRPLIAGAAVGALHYFGVDAMVAGMLSKAMGQGIAEVVSITAIVGATHFATVMALDTGSPF